MFVAMTVVALINLRYVRRLPTLSALPANRRAEESTSGGDTGGAAVRCSVVVAARDEAARIEETVRRILAQQGVSIEAIVIDDRSADETKEILQRLASADSRVRTVRVETLPEGWLGKCHACHVGASVATGEWILFIDADCWLMPDVLARALCVAASEGVDHITLTPGVVPQTCGARAWHLALLTRLASRVAGVNRDHPRAHLGLGAFNLVRAAAYMDCGGYEALRLTVLDDVTLGLLLHRAGRRTRAFIGAVDAECHWGTTVRGMIKIMEKNYFAAAKFRVGPVVAMGLFTALLFGTALAGPWVGTPDGVAAAVALWTLALPAAILARRLGWSSRCAALAPLLYPVLVYAVINSAVVTLRQGGVRWRDTFYPLDILRNGMVE